jgi:hypothetical protein
VDQLELAVVPVEVRAGVPAALPADAASASRADPDGQGSTAEGAARREFQVGSAALFNDRFLSVHDHDVTQDLD